MKTLASIFFISAMFVCTGITAQDDILPDISIRQDSLDTEIKEKKEALIQAMENVRMEHFIINTEDHRFGYYIMLDGKIYIEQTTIPAIQGLQGFISKDEATRVSKFVIDKIKQGELPPTVTIEDLKHLNISLPR